MDRGTGEEIIVDPRQKNQGSMAPRQSHAGISAALREGRQDRSSPSCTVGGVNRRKGETSRFIGKSLNTTEIGDRMEFRKIISLGMRLV